MTEENLELEEELLNTLIEKYTIFKVSPADDVTISTKYRLYNVTQKPAVILLIPLGGANEEDKKRPNKLRKRNR